MAFDQYEFRDALSAFATGVTIVTARDLNGNPVGMTASSFNSVSMNPPLVLWSVTKTALSAPAFHDAKHFAIHVLGFDQTELSNKFAKSGADKFADLPDAVNDNDVPILTDVAARFDCKQWAIYEGGDHWIIIGEVVDFQRIKKDGLVFSGGSYATATPMQPYTWARDDLVTDAPIENLVFYNLSRAYHQVANDFHERVRDAGLTLPEWRILSSLSGGMSYPLADLSTRTFIQPAALLDMLHSMDNDGLCKLSGSGLATITHGTSDGDAKVSGLMHLIIEQEKHIFGARNTAEAQTLFSLLRKVVEQTNS